MQSIKIEQPKNKRDFIKLRLGKNNIFHVNKYGYSLEKNLDQFCLKTENKGVYNQIGTNKKYSSMYDCFISPELIKKKGYAYIEYVGTFLDFNNAYCKSIDLQKQFEEKDGLFVNIFIYQDKCYLISPRFRKIENRCAFKSIEDEVLDKKYRYTQKRKVKTGLQRSQAIIRKILGIRGQ